MSGRLLFADEFNAFDATSKTDGWRTAYPWGPGTVINREKAYYADTENGATTNPFSVSDGVLSITAAPAIGTIPTGQPYTSGVISSLGGFERQYGYFEVRADLPGGKGFWPAFWLLPADRTSGPELDIMEFSSRLPNEYATTAHSNAGGAYTMSQRFNKGLPDLSAGFHSYGVDWQPDKVTWYFDDSAVYSIATPADFHKPMYMLINQAVGGSGGGWIGDPDGSAQGYGIDYVRVYDAKPGSDPAPPAPVVQTGATSGSGDDSLAGTTANDTMRGGPGNDRILGDLGDDQLYGDADADLLNGGPGSDMAHGGGGDDEVHGGADNDEVHGGGGNDTVFGDRGADSVTGDLGNDAVYGGAEADTLHGGAGDDTLSGGAMDDVLHGGADNDLLSGNLGDDRLFGDRGDDALTGGAGADLFGFAAGSGHDSISDFDAGAGDRIGLDGVSWSVAADASGALVSFSGADSVLLLGIAPNAVTEAWFVRL